MAHVSSHSCPVHERTFPQVPLPVVSHCILPDLQIVYSNPNYSYHANPQYPQSATAPPPANMPCLQPPDCAPYQAEPDIPCKVPGCTECPPPAKRETAVASATRTEAEHWVARILGFDLDYLRTLSSADFQEKINIALTEVQHTRPEVQGNSVPYHAHAHASAACAPVAHNNRCDTEEWLERILEIPRDILQKRSDKQLNALVNAALVDYHVQHR